MEDQNKERKLPVINNEKKLKAFILRFQGHNYETIHEQTGYTVRTLQLYFSKGGRWHEHYQSWKTFQMEDINERVSSMFTAQALASLQQIVNLSQGNAKKKIAMPDGTERIVNVDLKGDTILRASQDILDRAGFKPAEKVVTEVPEDEAEKIAKFFDDDDEEAIESKQDVKKE